MFKLLGGMPANFVPAGIALVLNLFTKIIIYFPPVFPLFFLPLPFLPRALLSPFVADLLPRFLCADSNTIRFPLCETSLPS